MKKYKNRDWLYNEYVVKDRSLAQIAKECYCSKETIRDWRKKHKIIPREKGFLRRHTYKYIKEQFEKEGYTLLTNEYKKCNQLLEFICPKGHRHQIRYGSFQQGQRCGKCKNSIRLNINFIREKFEKEKYILLTKEYKNALQPLEFICPQNHKGKIKWRDFKDGCRCKQCFLDRTTIKYPEEELKKYRVKVRGVTKRSYNRYKYLINPNELPRGKGYELDHIYTVIDGFKNSVPPEVVASPINLQMLTAFENNNKSDRSDMTKETLYELYNQFKKE